MNRAALLLTMSLCVGPIWAQATGSDEGQQAAEARHVKEMMTQLSQQVDQFESQLGDWADLNRYREENATIGSVPQGNNEWSSTEIQSRISGALDGKLLSRKALRK